jgi:hypothetical protein
MWLIEQSLPDSLAVGRAPNPLAGLRSTTIGLVTGLDTVSPSAFRKLSPGIEDCFWELLELAMIHPQRL